MTRTYPNFTTVLDDYLQDPQFAADFLSGALEEEDFDVFLLALKDIMRVHGNLSAIAKKAHLNRGTLYKLFSENANPEMKTILAVLDSLGYGLRVTKKKRSRPRRKTVKRVARPRRRKSIAYR